MKSPYDQLSKYERIPEPGNPSQTEAWAMLEAAKRLASAILHQSDDEKQTRDVRKDALRLNWRLWTIIQAELSQERPDLPDEVQSNMINLCNFVDKHTVGALLSPTPENLSVLIDINRNIATGLLQRPEGVEDPNQQTNESDTKTEENQSFDAKV